ncbi:transketolase family protein [uncultured Dubosiella sp.]|uniref:transketolase family protein n=1 Tax=uncultured Dubosiella sp. TaxID=1937011 RepID=UPI00272F2724|nr:transketolase family protein [uncultured Dubosiella sp.]
MKQTIATRASYGEALKELGAKHDDVFVLDADLSGATMTKGFKETYPDRFIDCGIAEANMLGVAAGLSTTGLVPFASTFAIFAAGRGYEQIRNSIAYPHLNVKICATHAGISVGEDGATHQAIEDMALMRAIPGMVVLCPCDDQETRACIEAAYAYEGPVYVRLGRLPVDAVYANSVPFKIGKGNIVQEGKDVALIACGMEVQEAVKAAQILAVQGIRARVVNMPSIKPIDRELILDCARTCGKIVTIEEHSVVGGLGSAICEIVSAAQPVPVCRIGVQDEFGQSGNGKDLIEAYGLDSLSIAYKVKQFLSPILDLQKVKSFQVFTQA